MIVMCFNNKEPFLIQAKVVLKSIELNSSSMPAVLYLVNFESHNFNSIYECINVNLDLKYITAYSLVAMYNTLSKYKTSILWLDVDTIVRGELSDIFSDVKPNTLKILKREDADAREASGLSVFNTGVVAVGYSEETLLLLKEASEMAMANPIWTADQLYLYRTYKKYKNNIDLINLVNHREWHDIGGRERKNPFDKKSIIWHCKSSHFNESPYKEEYEYYKGVVDENTV